MKKLVITTVVIFFFIACKKDPAIRTSCNKLTPIAGWNTIDFKTNYTIQVPVNFIGQGMTGFEGYTFSKNSPDTKITLTYSYCGPLHCNDFGDTLVNPAPAHIEAMNDKGDTISLNKTEYFCQNFQTVGILYFANDSIRTGRLYWKDHGIMKQALELEYYPQNAGTIKKIIKSIKQK